MPGLYGTCMITYVRLKIHLFLAMLGPRWGSRAFSSCSKWGLLSSCSVWLLIVVASVVAEHGLWGAGFSSCDSQA